jgi:hypothetical protein
MDSERRCQRRWVKKGVTYVGFRHLLVAGPLHNVPDLVLREGITNSNHFLV